MSGMDVTAPPPPSKPPQPGVPTMNLLETDRSTAPDLPPARRLLLEGVLAAWVGFMVTTFILSPRATLQGLMFGIPIAGLTWYLWSFRDD